MRTMSKDIATNRNVNHTPITMKNTTNTAALASELSFLRTVVIAAHTAKIDAAWEVMADAEIAFEAAWGFRPQEATEYAPGYMAAKAAYDALQDDSGYFWTLSRIHDLSMMVEGTGSGQLFILAPATLEGCCVHVVGIGHMPIASAEVAPFIARTLGYAQAA